MKTQLYKTLFNGVYIIDTYENLIELTKGFLGYQFIKVTETPL